MNLGSTDYVTKDLGEAAYLYAEGCRFSGLEEGQGFYWFVFRDSSRCEHLAHAYWFGEATVAAMAYSQAIRQLKDLLHAHGPRRKMTIRNSDALSPRST